MYFKISFDDQYANLGLINAVASYYLEEGDEGFEKYIKEFPNRTPFRHHEHQFNPDATVITLTAKTVSFSLQRGALQHRLSTKAQSRPFAKYLGLRSHLYQETARNEDNYGLLQ